MLESRIYACRNALPVLNRNLDAGSGDRDCLRHWISGIELSLLKSQKATALLDYYSGDLQASRLKGLLEKNFKMMKAFEELWLESVTERSLEQEKDIKFRRDIRILENMIST